MNLLDWIVYAVVISAVIGLTAWSLDGVLRALGRPSRRTWFAAMILSAGVPSGALVLDALSIAIAPAAEQPVVPLDSSPGRLAAPPSFLLTTGSLLREAQSWLARGVVCGAGALSSLPTNEVWIKRAWAGATLALTLVLAVTFGRLWFDARRWKRATLLGRDVWISQTVGPATIGIFRPPVQQPVRYDMVPVLGLP